MIDLEDLTGLPIKMDMDTGQLFYDDNLDLEDEYFIPLSELSHVLLNKSIKYPENVYKLHKNLMHKKSQKGDCELGYDLVYMPYGLLGIEYIKTHIYYSECEDSKYDSIIEVYSGTLTAVIQKNSEDCDPYAYETEVDDIVLVQVKKGQRLAIPRGVYYTFLNTGDVPVVYGRVVSPKHQVVDYATLQRQKGLAYYIISKNARMEIVANPKYKLNCELQDCQCVDDYNERWKDISDILASQNDSLYMTLSSNPDRIRKFIL